MDLSGRNLWQVGAGDTERSYADVCLRHGVMLIGPGRLGRYTEEAYAPLGDIRHSIRRFCLEARRGDVVLLRLGTGRVVAVGEIADDGADWHEAFCDVDGWDLRHIRRVRWYPNSAADFPAKTLGGQVRSFAAVNVAAVRTWVERLAVSNAFSSALPALPAAGAPLGRSELGRRLFIEGLPSERVDRVLTTLASLDRIASWYTNEIKRPEGRPSEHETVAYLVMPLLFALGWSQQTAAIEWRSIDVALFDAMPASDATLACVVEAKLLTRSVFLPVGQARDYAARAGRDRCTRLIVTDGIRYTIHLKRDGQFALAAYLNLLDMRDSYPALVCAGAVDAVLLMAR